MSNKTFKIMKKVYLFAGMAAMMLASCSSNDRLDASPNDPGQQTAVRTDAVGFDVYTSRVSGTRYGAAGETTTAAIQKAWDQTTDPSNPTYGGFGVFGYYTDNNDYDQLATPNFFYNQLVEYDQSNMYWNYDPIRYWPNEYGSSAISDDADRVSFFAYAPYVEVNPSNGKPTDQNNGDEENGITQISRNTANGDPIIKYVSSFQKANAVDLCWGVNETNTWTTVVDGQQQTFTKGLPWLNVQRPREAATQEAAAQRVKFNFKHALAKMKVNIDAFVDGYDKTNPLDANTRIWVRSIRFNGFAMKGALNLNNEDPYKPYWMNYNCMGDLEADGDIVVYDGRRDGKEAMGNSVATNEKVIGLNPALIQDENTVTAAGKWVTTGTKLGVTNNTVPMFENNGAFYVIPVTDATVEVEIVYDVETIDPNLANTISDGKTHGSSIENRISKTVNFGGVETLEAGKGYEINLHLGMNSVKFDAAVTDWDNITMGTDVDLPANMPIYTAAPSTENKVVNIDIPGYMTPLASSNDFYYFGVNGLLSGENVTVQEGADQILTSAQVFSSGAKLVAGTADDKANISGVAYIKAKQPKYYGVENVNGREDLVIKSASGKQVTLSVKLLAVKLGLTAPTTKTAGASTYTLLRTDGSQDLGWSSSTDPVTFVMPDLTGFTDAVTTPNNYIRVWLNGAELVKADTAGEGHFVFNKTTGELTVWSTGTGGITVAGDVIKVTMKTGDVAEETIVFEIE